jgi:hypothetical protein
MTAVHLPSSLAPWRWFSRGRRPRRRRPAGAACGLVGANDRLPAPPGDDDVPRGCAWYPSSFELVRGTDVREGDDVAGPVTA